MRPNCLRCLVREGKICAAVELRLVSIGAILLVDRASCALNPLTLFGCVMRTGPEVGWMVS